MRRSELNADNADEITELLENVEIGYLGIMTPNGYPRIVPLNFVAIERRIYFHGATEGEKFEALTSEPKVTFNVDRLYAIIPSDWIANRGYACPATTFYKSITIKGKGRSISDLTEKAESLQRIMEKYQPQGGYQPIDASNEMYKKPLEEVAVFRIDPEQLDFKKQFGQSLSAEVRREVIERLFERNLGNDHLAAAEIRKMLT